MPMFTPGIETGWTMCLAGRTNGYSAFRFIASVLFWV